ncbi:MAG: hypothetical protein J5736_02480 [Bacilli bacterium]|nr:hypothetical protein [Bacilli bacterium]
MKILFTGFLPFSTHKENPSKILAEELASFFSMPYRILSVSYIRAPIELADSMEKEKPDFILSLGLHAGAKALRIEEFAYNLKQASLPDEDGISMQGSPINVNLPESIPNPLPLPKCLEEWKGYPFVLSDDPGRFVCNLVYFHDLSSGIPSLFVHLPPFEIIPKEKQLEALIALVKSIHAFF